MITLLFLICFFFYRILFRQKSSSLVCSFLNIGLPSLRESKGRFCILTGVKRKNGLSWLLSCFSYLLSNYVVSSLLPSVTSSSLLFICSIRNFDKVEWQNSLVDPMISRSPLFPSWASRDVNSSILTIRPLFFSSVSRVSRLIIISLLPCLLRSVEVF